MDGSTELYLMDQLKRRIKSASKIIIYQNLFILYNIISLCLVILIVFTSIFLLKLNYEYIIEHLTKWSSNDWNETIKCDFNRTIAFVRQIRESKREIAFSYFLPLAIVILFKSLTSFFVFKSHLDKILFRFYSILISVEFGCEVGYSYKFFIHDNDFGATLYLALGVILAISFIHSYTLWIFYSIWYHLKEEQEEDEYEDE